MLERLWGCEMGNDNINLFTHYKQPENAFTNGLVWILKILHKTKNHDFNSFIKERIGVKISKNVNFRVLGEFKGTADAQIVDDNKILQIETKITSSYYKLFDDNGKFNSLSLSQLKMHKKVLQKEIKKIKKLILITPDFSDSYYVKEIIRRIPSITHISWHDIYNFFRKLKIKDRVLNELIQEFNESIKNEIIDKDYVAGFFKYTEKHLSGYDNPNDYFNEMFKKNIGSTHIPFFPTFLSKPGRKAIFGFKGNLIGECEIIKIIPSSRKGFLKYRMYINKNKTNRYKPPIPYKQVIKIEPLKKIKGRPNRCNLTSSDYLQLQNIVNKNR